MKIQIPLTTNKILSDCTEDIAIYELEDWMRPDIAANAAEFGLSEDVANPCPGCGREWMRTEDDTLERTHMVGCPFGSGVSELAMKPETKAEKSKPLKKPVLEDRDV